MRVCRVRVFNRVRVYRGALRLALVTHNPIHKDFLTEALERLLAIFPLTSAADGIIVGKGGKSNL